jgi:RNA polymerase sigma-70 factor (ECF subfamily)
MELLERSPHEVLVQFSAGDRDAFEVLFRQFQAEVYSWIVRIVRDPAVAEDSTVETFWRIHRAHARFDPARSFGAWARRIATNVALDYLKSPRTREVQLPENFEPGAAHTWTPTRFSTANPAIQREVRERIQLALHQLPPKLQIIATLALVEEQSHSEIADVLNLSTQAVKSRLFRAVRLLRTKLKSLDVSRE